jgi:hypothetical protein
MFRKNTIVAVALGGVLLIGGALPSLADERSDCEQRVREAEYNLQLEIDRHGEQGRDVDERRQYLERERQNCLAYDQSYDNDRRDNDRHDNDRHDNDRREGDNYNR